MTLLQKIQLAILVLNLLKDKDITLQEIVTALLPYIDKSIGQEEARAATELVALLVSE